MAPPSDIEIPDFFIDMNCSDLADENNVFHGPVKTTFPCTVTSHTVVELVDANPQDNFLYRVVMFHDGWALVSISHPHPD